MKLNLCHFPITADGVTYPASGLPPLVFTPILHTRTHSPYPVLLGFEPPKDLPKIPAGTQVIVPRFAAATSWAWQAKLDAYCVPLSGKRQPDGSFICNALEPAPEQLGLSFPEDELDVNEMDESAKIVRAVGGVFTIEVDGGPDLPPVPAEQTAYRYPDGTIHIPRLDLEDSDDGVAIVVPQDGKIIEFMALMFPAAALLVTDVTQAGKRTRLFQVR